MNSRKIEGPNAFVLLSEAKDHLEGIERRKMILRFAQDDICSFLATMAVVIPPAEDDRLSPDAFA